MPNTTICPSECARAHDYLVSIFASDVAVSKMFEFNGFKQLVKANRRSLLEHLCRAIAGQQLSTKAASTIWGRVKNQQIVSGLAFISFVSAVDYGSLRACGLSNAKTKTILGLADAHQQGLLNARAIRQLETEALIGHLSQFWGVGRWTAEMCAIGYFNKTDIWAEGDVGLQNAMQALYPDNESAKTLALEKASPYCSYWSLHLWAALDNGFFSDV